MITFNNLCLKHVGVAFYYLARSLTTVTNVAFTFVILRKFLMHSVINLWSFVSNMGTIIIIPFHYVLQALQSQLELLSAALSSQLATWLESIKKDWVVRKKRVNFQVKRGCLLQLILMTSVFICFIGNISMLGIVYGILSSCFVSLNSIYTKKVLPAVDNSVWALTLYNNLNASLLFLPLMFIFQELPNIIFVSQIQEVSFWMLMTLGGVCGVCIGSITGLQIKVWHSVHYNELVEF